MAVNQAQVDQSSSPESAENEKVQKLQEEVDLIKVSIKRLLIDIRERMNEIENPFIQVAGVSTPQVEKPEGIMVSNPGATGKSSHHADTGKARPAPQSADAPADITKEATPGVILEGDTVFDEGMLTDTRVMAMRSRLVDKQRPKAQSNNHQEKIRLTKVHHIFEWTGRMVKKYGHDRLDLMLQSYRAMGYLTKESCEQVKEISRLMPSCLGESHDISPDEFIRELYALNRILDPSDTSLDRDMIEVLMEQRRVTEPVKADRPMEKENQDSWVKIPDGI